MCGQFSADYAVLGILLGGPAHGYELRRRLHCSLGPIWHIAQSQLYSTLHRLEAQGLVSVYTEKPGERPPRKVYSLTKKGEDTFWKWAISPVRHVRDIRVELFAKLYFLRRYCPDRIPPFLNNQIQFLRRLRDRLLHRKALPSDDPLLGKLAIEFRLSQVESVLRWLSECQAQFGKEES